MKIGITVDGKLFNMKGAHDWAYNEIGVLHGTDIMARTLADAVHQENGTEERVIFSDKGLRNLISVITAQAVVGAYLRGCLLLEQIEDPVRKAQLTDALETCYPAKGYGPHEDSLNGFAVSPMPEMRILEALREDVSFDKATAKVIEIVHGWTVEDHVGGSYSSSVLPYEFDIVI